jgi:hypothetical protein
MFFKKVIILTIIVFTSLILYQFALAFNLDTDNMFKGSAAKYGYDVADESTLSSTAGKVINIALGLVGTIFLAFSVYAGFLWLTARGSEEEVKKATGILKTSVIGIVIATSAYAITSFVLPKILEKTTGENGGIGSVQTTAGMIGCCKKCSSSLSPDDPGCSTYLVNDQTECQGLCPTGSSVFNCYYSLRVEEECK